MNIGYYFHLGLNSRQSRINAEHSTTVSMGLYITLYIYKKITNVDSPIKQPNSSCYTNFPLGFWIMHFLNIHRWLNIANITPNGPDDGSVETKGYSVDFLINPSFHLDYLVINFSVYYIYIYSLRGVRTLRMELNCCHSRNSEPFSELSTTVLRYRKM